MFVTEVVIERGVGAAYIVGDGVTNGGRAQEVQRRRKDDVRAGGGTNCRSSVPNGDDAQRAAQACGGTSLTSRPSASVLVVFSVMA